MYILVLKQKDSTRENRGAPPLMLPSQRGPSTLDPNIFMDNIP